MSRYSKLLLKFNRVKKNLKRAAYLARLPALPFVVKQSVSLEEQGVDAEGVEWIDYLRGATSIRDAPGYSEHNRLHEEAAAAHRMPVKEYLFDPNSDGADDMEFTEWPEGFPPAIPTD